MITTDISISNNLLIFLIPSAWLMVGLTTVGVLLIVGYLKSKPPLAQTILDNVNAVCFTSITLSSLSFTICVTLKVMFEDSGEVIASILAIAVPSSTTNLQMQMTLSFIIQSLLVIDSSYLEGEHLENTVMIGTWIIPTTIIIVYTFLQTQGVKGFIYDFLRGTLTQDWIIGLELPTGRILVTSTLLVVCAVTRLWLLKIRYETHEQENSVMNSKVTLAIMVHCLCVSCTVSLAAFFTILKLFPNFHLFAMMIGILSYFIIVALSAFTNTHVRTYTTSLYPFSLISQLRSLRQQRRVACEMVNDLSVVTRGNSRSS